MIDVKKISAFLPNSWKKTFNNEIVITTKMRFCNDSSEEKYCGRCIFQIIENKELEANLNLLKRQAPNQSVICSLNINCNFHLFAVIHLLCNIVFFILYYIHWLAF